MDLFVMMAGAFTVVRGYYTAPDENGKKGTSWLFFGLSMMLVGLILTFKG